MACTDCSKAWGVCDCCKLVDGNETFKPVMHCNICNANICSDCERNWPKRSVAYFVKKGIQISNAIKSFFS